MVSLVIVPGTCYYVVKHSWSAFNVQCYGQPRKYDSQTLLHHNQQQTPGLLAVTTITLIHRSPGRCWFARGTFISLIAVLSTYYVCYTTYNKVAHTFYVVHCAEGPTDETDPCLVAGVRSVERVRCVGLRVGCARCGTAASVGVCCSPQLSKVCGNSCVEIFSQHWKAFIPPRQCFMITVEYSQNCTVSDLPSGAGFLRAI